MNENGTGLNGPAAFVWNLEDRLGGRAAGGERGRQPPEQPDTVDRRRRLRYRAEPVRSQTDLVFSI